MALVVSVNPLTPLMTLLGFHAHGCDGTGLKAGKADGLSGFFAEAIGVIVDAANGGINLRNEFPLSIPCPQFQRPICLRRGPVGKVWMVLGFLLQVGQGFARLAQNVLFPGL